MPRFAAMRTIHRVFADAPHRKDVQFVMDANLPLTAQGGVLVRATAATYFDTNGVMQTAGSGVERSAHYIKGRRAHLFEPAGTNKFLRSSTFDNATWTNPDTAPTITSGQADLAGGTAAYLIDDTSATHIQGIRQTVTVANDSTVWCVSVFIKKGGTGAFPIVNLRFTGGTTIDHYVYLNTATGAINLVSSAGTGAAVGIVDLDNGWWRLFLTAPNNTSGNTSCLVSIYPAGGTSINSGTQVSPTGSNTYFGAQLENTAYPTSYVATTTVAVTRNADLIYVPVNATQGDLTIYLRWRHLVDTTNSGNVHVTISAASNANPRVFLVTRGAASGLSAEYTNAAGTNKAAKGSQLLSSLVQNDVIEGTVRINRTGLITYQTNINGTDGYAATIPAAQAFDGAGGFWSGTSAGGRLYIGSAGSGAIALPMAVEALGVFSRAERYASRTLRTFCRTAI